MDQVRTALAWLKKHHFWVLSGLVALIGFACWWSASKKLSAMYDTNQKMITAEFNNLKSVRGAAFHPNAAINERQEAETKKQAESVLKLWQQQYDRQRDTVLKWPAALSQEFRDAVEKKQFNDDIPWELRNNYQNYIQQHFPELPKQVGAREMEAGLGGLGSPGGGRMFAGPEGGGAPGQTFEDDTDYICEWYDQNVIREELDFPQRPSSLRIWVTQEDLWVYHTLLDVIAKTNQAANATRMSNAAVKTIFSLEVGKRAAVYSRQAGRLLVPPATAVAIGGPGEAPGGPDGMVPGGGGPEGAGRPMMMGGPEAGGMPGAAMSPAAEQGYLLSYRYLDEKGQPISVGGAATAGVEGPGMAADPAASGPAPPLDLSTFGKGYKRLPIRMVLRMDGRWLPQLISTCANEPLRVEVQEVRINTPDIAGLTSGGGGSPGGFQGLGGGGAPGGGAAGANLFPDHNGILNFPAQPNVVNVVIQGTIYIFNKPDPNILQSPGEQPVAATP